MTAAVPSEVGYRKDLLQAAALLKPLLEEFPQDEELRVMQLELLKAVPGEFMPEALGCKGEDYAALLNNLLTKHPDSTAYRLAYARMVVPPSFSTYDSKDFSRAADYMQKIYAVNPTNVDLLPLYLAARDRYASALERDGKKEEAAKAREKTLGVLALLTEREDFTLEMRTRLIRLVSMLPNEAGASKAQKEEEIDLLLRKYDVKQRRDIIKKTGISR